MKQLIAILFSLSFIASCWYGCQIYSDVHERKTLMEDYAEINMVNYELFNIQIWKEEAIEIFQKKIKEFEISDGTYKLLDLEIQGYLKRLYKQYFESGELINIIAENMEAGGKVNKVFLNLIKTQVSEQLNELDLKSKIPGLSNQVVEEIRSNEPVLRGYFEKEIFRLMLDNASQQYVDRRTPIYQRYNQTDAPSTDQYLSDRIAKKDAQISKTMKLGIGLLALSLTLAWFLGSFWTSQARVAGLTLCSVVFLILGVGMPMIDIDARLNSFDFLLMDEPIHFDEQIIYYQSKSIVEVTKTLWQGQKWDLKLVGALVLLFSIVFPFCKLLLSGGYLFFEKIRNSKLAKNIIFHLGKWSMADVFVVAMFMAYIGFYGIISSQLNAISSNRIGFTVDTINYSRLSPGAFFFTAYTVLSICISILINRHDQSSTVDA